MTLKELLDRLLSDEAIWWDRGTRPGEQRRPISYSSSLLSAVASVFEERGLVQARVFAASKSGGEWRSTIQGVLRVLDHIAECPQALEDRPVGRTIIKSLVEIRKAFKTRKEGGRDA